MVGVDGVLAARGDRAGERRGQLGSAESRVVETPPEAGAAWPETPRVTHWRRRRLSVPSRASVLKLVGELGMTEVAEEVFEWFAAKTVNLGS